MPQPLAPSPLSRPCPQTAATSNTAATAAPNTPYASRAAPRDVEARAAAALIRGAGGAGPAERPTAAAAATAALELLGAALRGPAGRLTAAQLFGQVRTLCVYRYGQAGTQVGPAGGRVTAWLHERL